MLAAAGNPIDCTCPDWASLCKHVATALYGTAVRLDQAPELFFSLRGLQVADFIGTVVQAETSTLLARSRKKSGRILSRKDAVRLFDL